MKTMATSETCAVVIRCVVWDDFARLSKQAEMAVYELKASEQIFRICALKGNVFVYEERLPLPQRIDVTKDKDELQLKALAVNVRNSEHMSEFAIISREVIRKTLRCGLPYSIVPRLIKEKNKWTVEFEYQMDPEETKKFLSHILDVPQESIIQGDVLRIF